RDILDLSRVEAGKLEVLEERVNLRRSLQLVLKMISQQAQEGQVRLITDAVPEDMVILADKKRMHQVFLNLVSNAVKFTPEGGQVEISAALTDDGGAVIVVGDTGIGMSQAEIEEAMTPFGQIDSIMTRKKEGTGLGLPLVKAFVERQGGRLVIESEPGKGTNVKMLFPPDRILDP
ncbi:MAG: HAMP domain-containing sensor histidine kinase, partial [Sphingomonadales bacterium]